MAYTFSDSNNKRFIAWEDLLIEIKDGKLTFSDKTDPSVTKEFPLDYYYSDDSGKSYGEYKITEKSTCRDLGVSPAWIISPTRKVNIIEGKAFIWVPSVNE